MMRLLFSDPCRPSHRSGGRARAESLETRTLLNAADLDPAFGTGGILDSPGFRAAGSSTAAAVALAGAGKMIVAGSVGRTFDDIPAAARLNPDGSLDTSFGDSGWASVPYPDAPARHAVATAVAVQPDEKVVIGWSGANVPVRFARFDSDGSLDRTFAGGSTALSTAGLYDVAKIKVLPDGKILATGGLEFIWVARFNADGTLDATFGAGGLASVDPSSTYDRPQDLTVDPAGRVVVAGSANWQPPAGQAIVVRFNTAGRVDTTFGGGDGVAEVNLPQSGACAVHAGADNTTTAAGFSSSGIFLAHFLADGSPDPAFGAGGRVLAPDPPGAYVQALSFRSMDFMNDGRFMAAAPSIYQPGPNDRVVVRRFLADGTIDSAFGAAGEARSPTFATPVYAPDIVVSPQGEAVVAARANVPDGDKHVAAVARFTPAGQPDPSFGGGVATAPSYHLEPVPLTRLAESLDGKLMAAGTFEDQLVVGRFNRDGSPDTSFDSDGWVILTVPGGFGGVSSFQTLPDGKLLIGSTRPLLFSAPASFLLIRLNPNGTFDNTFGAGGVAAAPVPSGSGTQATVVATAVQADGKILATGPNRFVHGQSMGAFVTARFNPDGSLDTGFGSGGLAVTDVDPAPLPENPTDVAVLSDGGILVGGSAKGQWAFVRYRPDGTPDLNFGNQFNQPGVELFSPGTVGGALADLQAMPAGGFLAAGSSGSNDLAVARIRADGTPDPAFGDSGVAFAGFSSSEASSLSAIRLDRESDGKILVGGSAFEGSAMFAAVRFNPDGSLDPSFGSRGRWVITTGVQPSDMALLSDGGIVFLNPTGSLFIRLKGDAPAALAPTARGVFYNGSAYDDNDRRVTPADNEAVAVDKQALLPGQAPSFPNVTSYTKGINGVVVELNGVPPGELLPGDFIFRAGRTGPPSVWQEAPAPAWVALLPAAAGDKVSRYAITWAGDAVRNAWLQVTVKANARTGLASPDVFYFGNLVGETGDEPAFPLVVNGSDYRRTRAAIGKGIVASDSRFDFNRNGRVDVVDVAAVRGNWGRSLPPPPQAEAPAAGFGADHARRRRPPLGVLRGGA